MSVDQSVDESVDQVEQILASPGRVRCPAPMSANLSMRQCLINQQGARKYLEGPLEICLKCETGKGIRAAHPEFKALRLQPQSFKFAGFAVNKPAAGSPSPQPSSTREEGEKMISRQGAKAQKVNPPGAAVLHAPLTKISGFRWGKDISSRVKKRLLEELAGLQGGKVSRGQVSRLAAAYNVPIEAIRQAVKR